MKIWRNREKKLKLSRKIVQNVKNLEISPKFPEILQKIARNRTFQSRSRHTYFSISHKPSYGRNPSINRFLVPTSDVCRRSWANFRILLENSDQDATNAKVERTVLRSRLRIWYPQFYTSFRIFCLRRPKRNEKLVKTCQVDVDLSLTMRWMPK